MPWGQGCGAGCGCRCVGGVGEERGPGKGALGGRPQRSEVFVWPRREARFWSILLSGWGGGCWSLDKELLLRPVLLKSSRLG